MVKIRLQILLFIVMTMIFGSILFFSSLPTQVQVEKAPVAATIFPIYDIARVIAGDAIHVNLILRPGESPHTFDPKPSTLRALDEAQVIYVVGYGFDDWVNGLIQSVDAQKVIVDKNIDIRESDSYKRGVAGDDPHYWLTVNNGKIIARTIAVDLAERFPEHKETIQENLHAYLSELDGINDQIISIIEPISNKNLITLHDAWYYFAQEYGLNIVGTFEPSAGREPTPQYLLKFTRAIEVSGSNTLYSEPQLGTQSIAAFVKDQNLNIAELDPIGGYSDRNSFIELLLYNAQIIAQNQD